MHKLEYLQQAIDDILEAEAYLHELSPPAADRFSQSIEEKMEHVAKHPLMCQAYEADPYFRRAVIGDYLLFYSVDEKKRLVTIHRVFHHTRDISRQVLTHRTPD